MRQTERSKSVYLVLGASGGIGSSVARKLSSAGHVVIPASKPSKRLDNLARELHSPSYTLDATSFEETEACFAKVNREFGTISGVLNCVGSLCLKPAHLTRESEWLETVSANLTTAFATVRSAAKTMVDDGGSVVLMSSAAARTGLANHEAISAAKAGVIGLVQSASASYASYNLRFNAVAPGLVKTPLTRKIWEKEKSASMAASLHPLRRFGEPHEIASLICWLLDSANSWITGGIFSADGGLSSSAPPSR